MGKKVSLPEVGERHILTDMVPETGQLGARGEIPRQGLLFQLGSSSWKRQVREVVKLGKGTQDPNGFAPQPQDPAAGLCPAVATWVISRRPRYGRTVASSESEVLLRPLGTGQSVPSSIPGCAPGGRQGLRESREVKRAPRNLCFHPEALSDPALRRRHIPWSSVNQLRLHEVQAGLNPGSVRLSPQARRGQRVPAN